MSTDRERWRLDPLALPPETTGRFWMCALAVWLLVWGATGVLVPTRNLFATVYDTSPELQKELDRAVDEAVNGRLVLDPRVVRDHYSEWTAKLGQLTRHYDRLLWLPAVLAGFLLAAWTGYRRLPAELDRKYGIRPLARGEAPRLQAEVESLCRRQGLAVPSELAVRPGLLNGLLVQGKRGPRLVIDGEPERLKLIWSDLHRAVLAHELGHLANGDLRHREVVRAAWKALGLLLPVIVFVTIGLGGRFDGKWLLRSIGTACATAWLWAGLVRARELYADAWAVRAGWGQALERRLHLPSPEPRGLRRLVWMHPSNAERLSYLRRPEKLFRVSHRQALLTGLLAGLLAGHAGGLLHDAALIWLQVTGLLGFATASLGVLFFGLAGAAIGGLAALGLLGYAVSSALGLQILRSAVADRALRPDSAWGYGQAVVPAFCFVAGVELGGLLSAFPVPSWSVLPTTMGFLALFTTALWMWWVQARMAGRWILAGATDHGQAKRWVKRLRFLAAAQLLLVLVPALLGRSALALSSQPEWVEMLSRPGHLEQEALFLARSSTFVFLSWSLAASAILGSAVLFLVLLGVVPSRRACPGCGSIRGGRIAVGRRCPSCGSHLASWLTLDRSHPETPISVGEADCGRRYEVAGAELPSP